MLLLQIIPYKVAREIRYLRSSILHPLSSHILADGDEFHLRRDDPGAGIRELGNDLAGFGAQWTTALTFEPGKFHETILFRLAGVLGMFAGEITVVLRLHFATVVFLHVAAGTNPFGA